MITRGAAIAVLTLVPALYCSSAQAQQITLTPQIGLGTLDQANPDPAFETSTAGRIDGAKSEAGSSVQAFLLRKDRGPHAGRYAVLVTAPAGAGRNIMPFARAFPSVRQYQLVGAQGLGTLPTVDVLGVHYFKVRPDRADAFDKFVAEKLNPAVGNLRPDLRFLYYKSPEGYISIIAITKASRDKYWPSGADSDDLKAAFTPAIKVLATELQPYLVDGSFGTGMAAAVYESKEWADWFVVAPPAR